MQSRNSREIEAGGSQVRHSEEVKVHVQGNPIVIKEF
jgi:hypothetical protein